MQQERRNYGRVIALVAVVMLAGGTLVALFQPWTANHFSYALPGKNNLPYRISWRGRDYANPFVCAGADWCAHPASLCPIKNATCQQAPPICTTGATLQSSPANEWPLHRVSTLNTLFGAGHAIDAPDYAFRSSATAIAMYVEDGPDCYVTYTLEGGP